MLYQDAKTAVHELTGPSSFTLLPSGTLRYILGASIQQSGTASTSEIKCGTTTIARNYGKDWPYNEMMYRCVSDIVITKTGQDSASYVVNYVEREVNVYDPRIASVSGSIKLENFTGRAGNAMHDLTYVMWMGFIVVLVALGAQAFLLFQRRK